MNEQDKSARISTILSRYQQLAGGTSDEIRTGMQPVLEGIPEKELLFLGTSLRGQMYQWDKEHRGEGPNPYAGVVYAFFPPVGGS